MSDTVNIKKDESCILYKNTKDDLIDDTVDNLNYNILADTGSEADDVLHNTPVELYNEIPIDQNICNPGIPDIAHFIYEELDDDVSPHKPTKSKLLDTNYLSSDGR